VAWFEAVHPSTCKLGAAENLHHTPAVQRHRTLHPVVILVTPVICVALPLGLASFHILGNRRRTGSKEIKKPVQEQHANAGNMMWW